VISFRQGLLSARRLFLHQPRLVLIAIVTLGLGIGLSGALFSVFRGTLFRRLPLPDSDRLVALGNLRQASGSGPEMEARDYLTLLERQKSFDGLAAYEMGFTFINSEQGPTATYPGAAVDASLFSLVRVRPLLGRAIEPHDQEPGSPRVAVLGFAVWKGYFQSDPGILGATILVDHERATVVGVMPKGFAFPIDQEIWTPLPVVHGKDAPEEGRTLAVLGRLAPDKSLRQARSELSLLTEQIAAESHRDRGALEITAEPFVAAHTDRRIRSALPIMLCSVLGVFLIACANVANLLLVRAASRGRDLALHSALGASPRQLFGQTLAESLTLMIPAAALGVLIAQSGIAIFNRLMEPAGFFRAYWVGVHLDELSILFLLGASLVASLLAGLLPAALAARTRPAEALRDGNLALPGRGTAKLRRSLVTGEIALACCLLIASGLMIRTVLNLTALEQNFETTDVLVAKLSLYQPGGQNPEALNRFFDQVAEHLAALPGVREVSFASSIPTQGSFWSPVEVEGQTGPATSSARYLVVSPGFFKTYGVSNLSGRYFETRDDRTAPPVALVNQSFGRRFLKHLHPEGTRIRITKAGASPTWATVVGVVPDLLMGSIDETRDAAAVYLPLRQIPRGSMFVSIRTKGKPALLAASVRREISRVDRFAALFDLESMDRVLARRRWTYDTFQWLFTAFGGAALFLAAVGIYGLVSVTTRARIPEFGIRAALGADSGRLRRLVLQASLLQVGLGVALGVALASSLGRFLKTLLFDVPTWDPAVYGSAALLLAAAGTLASLAPAQRAAQLDPNTALRSQ
jgi:putative ABC transport system permease protein